MIRVEGLTKIYNDFKAVDDVSFEIAAGEIVGLVGPNGAGKTTTLRSVAGILRPNTGRIEIDGHDLEKDPIAAKQGLAFVPDDPELFDYLSVEEHLRFVGRIYGVSDAPERIPRLLDELELVEHRNKLPDELSRGMRQKLAIACGLIHDPSALLFDEPLTGLDPGAIRRTKGTIRQRAEMGAGIVLSSHLLHLVEELCTRIVMIHRGRIIATGAIEDLVSQRPELEGRGLEEVFLALADEHS
jgi:ABC-2 type transport system ATP-binding protein